MKRISIISIAVAAVAIALGASERASAAQRTFVASTGSDAAACSLGAPCRSFAAAIVHTDPGGEVIVLDSAGYGPVTITQSVSIIAPPGVYAGVSVVSGDGITINGSGINVVLRGLSINGLGGAFGIRYLSGATLSVEDCMVSNMVTGVWLESAGTVSITGTTLINNGIEDFGDGIGIAVLASPLTVQINRSRIEASAGSAVRISGSADVTITDSVVAKNHFGLDLRLAGGTGRLAVDRTVVSDNSASAVIANAGTGSIAHLDITRSSIVRNAEGIVAGGSNGGNAWVTATNNEVSDNTGAGIRAVGPGGILRASGNKVMRNGIGLQQTAGGSVYTPGTNYVRDNSPDDGGHTADTRL